MDDNWGNILYLILMALFVIVGALKKKKKPVENFENNVAERAEEEMPANIENIFDAILGADTFAPQQDHPYQVIQEEIIEEETEDLSIEDIKNESIEYTTPKEMIIEDLDEVEEELEENQEIDWRQAIISKEILDRKYI